MARSNTRRWLITGATGFLGRHLVRELLDRGDQVRALVRQPPVEALPAAAEIRTGDVLAPATLEPAIEGCDGVFHLAGRVMREGSRDAVYRLHVDGTAHMLRAMHATGVRRMVLASTSGTVAVSTEPVVHGDDAPYAEIAEQWPYYHSKIYAEQVATGLAERLDLELVTLRPSLLLGPDDFKHSSTEDVRRYIRGEFPVVPEGGACILDVRDCAATFARAMSLAAPGERYLLGGANLSLRDFFHLVANIADVSPPVAAVPRRAWRLGAHAVQLAGRMGWVKRPDRVAMEMARHYWYCDWSRAVAELGHSPRPPMETLQDTIAWLQTWEPPLSLGDQTGKLMRLPWRTRG